MRSNRCKKTSHWAFHSMDFMRSSFAGQFLTSPLSVRIRYQPTNQPASHHQLSFPRGTLEGVILVGRELNRVQMLNRAPDPSKSPAIDAFSIVWLKKLI
jgi:hypothetical protein